MRERPDWLDIALAIATLLLLWMAVTPKAQAADVHVIINVTECESGGRYDAVGDNGKSVGIAQFQKATFEQMKREAHMPKLQWKNPIHQLRLMNWAIDHGYGKAWTCYRRMHPTRSRTAAHSVPLIFATEITPARRESEYVEMVKIQTQSIPHLKVDYTEVLNNTPSYEDTPRKQQYSTPIDYD